MRYTIGIFGSLIIDDENEAPIFVLNKSGSWTLREFDEYGNKLSMITSEGYYEKWEWGSVKYKLIECGRR